MSQKSDFRSSRVEIKLVSAINTTQTFSVDSCLLWCPGLMLVVYQLWCCIFLGCSAAIDPSQQNSLCASLVFYYHDIRLLGFRNSVIGHRWCVQSISYVTRLCHFSWWSYHNNLFVTSLWSHGLSHVFRLWRQCPQFCVFIAHHAVVQKASLGDKLTSCLLKTEFHSL